MYISSDVTAIVVTDYEYHAVDVSISSASIHVGEGDSPCMLHNAARNDPGHI